MTWRWDGTHYKPTKTELEWEWVRIEWNGEVAQLDGHFSIHQLEEVIAEMKAIQKFKEETSE